MFPNISPVETAAWKKLHSDQQFIKGIQMKSLFSEDPERFSRYSIIFGDILFDFSKNLVNAETFSHLFELAQECQVGEAIRAMFSGEKINHTENRSVLHTALRNFSGEPVFADGSDIMPEVVQELEHMKSFSRKIHSGEWRGYSGKPIRNIVNIGIGGSDLGPVMVTEALKHYWIDGMQAYFVSNVDATHLVETLKKINPEETLFLIASKTFTTQETMTNAYSAREWFLKSAGDESHIAKHFVALSTNEKEVVKFGIDRSNMFVFWDWVGGRYSLWSAIGLSIVLRSVMLILKKCCRVPMLQINISKTSPFEKNIPVIMALLGIWYRNFFGSQTEAILPYDQYMHRFAAYFQQGNMESNGKSVDRNGVPVKLFHRTRGLGRTGNQWPACILPADSPGNRSDSLRFYCSGHQP